MGIKPKILLVGLENFGTARLPRELQAAGFLVGLACRPQSFLAQTRFFDERFLLGPKNHGRGLMAAIRCVVAAWKPEWMMPMDDRTALFLAQVCRWNQANGRDAALARLLERSLGNPVAVLAAADKWQTWQAAEQTGIRVPAARLVHRPRDVSDFVAQHGFPVVLKHCFSHGGQGVHICQNDEPVQTALTRLGKKKSLSGRFLDWREKFRGRQMDKCWLPASQEIMISKFIAGQPAMLQAVAVEGRMLGALEAVAEKTFPHETGPASVVRFIRHDGMRQAAQTLLARWKLSGFVAFDFILDEQNRAWFLECNPRPIPISHLGSLVGEDLCRRFYSHLTAAPPPVEKTFQELVLAHFPKEQRRDPESPWLQRGLHDVPMGDPALKRALENEPMPWPLD